MKLPEANALGSLRRALLRAETATNKPDLDAALYDLDVALSAWETGNRASQREFALSDGSHDADFKPAGRINPTERLLDRADEIVGGTLVVSADFPDCVACGTPTGWKCSGTLIHPTLVLTARHCQNMQRVFAKGNSLRQMMDGVVLPVAQQISHPLMDISLLVLQTPAPADIPPRHIARDDEVRPRNNEALLMGFGITEIGGYITYGDKHSAIVPIRSLDATELDAATVARLRIRVGDEMIAGQRGLNIDSCQGDSGGSLYITDANGAIALLGVTSRGVPDGDQECGDGGIYVRADKFLDWIADSTGIRL